MQTIDRLNDAYAGRPVWIVLAGPSVRGFPLDRLKDEVTIGINDVIFHMQPTIHLFNDKGLVYRYWDADTWLLGTYWKNTICSRRETWKWPDGQIVVCRKAAYDILRANPVCHRLKIYTFINNGMEIKRQQGSLWLSSTVGTAAIQLAWRIGASEINLLGCDSYMKGHARYFYEPFEDEDPIHPFPETNSRHYNRDWRDIRGWLQAVAPDLPVLNWSADSACTVFPRRDWREKLQT